MNLHTTTRVPVNDSYASLLGKAVYVFAYYEWTIIYIIEKLEPGFVTRYSRGKPMTSGVVSKKFENVINPLPNTPQDLLDCHTKFSALVDRRNTLIHAHPARASDGSDILAYQTDPRRKFPNVQWSNGDAELLIKDIDNAAVEAGQLLEKLQ